MAPEAYPSGAQFSDFSICKLLAMTLRITTPSKTLWEWDTEHTCTECWMSHFLSLCCVVFLSVIVMIVVLYFSEQFWLRKRIIGRLPPLPSRRRVFRRAKRPPEPRNTHWTGRLSTMDLHFKVARWPTAECRSHPPLPPPLPPHSHPSPTPLPPHSHPLPPLLAWMDIEQYRQLQLHISFSL